MLRFQVWLSYVSNWKKELKKKKRKKKKNSPKISKVKYVVNNRSKIYIHNVTGNFEQKSEIDISKKKKLLG